MTFLSLDVVNEELGYKLEEGEICTMYYIKRNGIDEDKAYILAINLRGLILNLSNSQPKWKDKYFYVGGDIWGGDPIAPVRVIWKHNFDTSMPQDHDMLLHLGHDGKEKVCHLELENSLHMTYKEILIKPHFEAFLG